MQINKLIVMMILLICIPPVYAYDSESGLTENESYSIEYTEGYGYYEWKDPMRPNWYDPVIKLVLKIIALFITDETITVTHNVTKESWNGDSYEPTGDESGFSWDLTYDANQTTTTITTIDPVKEYFRDDQQRIDDFDTSDNHPDILNITTTINGDGTELDKQDYGYTTVSEESLKEIEKEIGGDYGFDIDSIGGEGGSVGLANQLDLSGLDEGSKETKRGFEIIFYGLIPLLFLLLWIKMSNKVMR